jgi:hypothetical protein
MRASGFLAQAFSLFGKVFANRINVYERTSLKHGALLSFRGRRERYRAFSSQVKATNRAVMQFNEPLRDWFMSQSLETHHS